MWEINLKLSFFNLCKLLLIMRLGRGPQKILKIFENFENFP